MKLPAPFRPPTTGQQLRLFARQALQRAIRDGHLVRRDVCERCGHSRPPNASRLGPEGVEAHHADYSQPLQVEWLCQRCHLAADKAQQPVSPRVVAPLPALGDNTKRYDFKGPLFRTDEAAAYLNYRGPNSLRSLYRFLKKQGVPTARRFRTVLIKKSDLDRAIGLTQRRSA